MPQEAWNAERERQYEHVRDRLKERGTPTSKAAPNEQGAAAARGRGKKR